MAHCQEVRLPCRQGHVEAFKNTDVQWLNIDSDRLRDSFVMAAFRQTKKQCKKDNKQLRYSDPRRQGACMLRMPFGVAICCFLATFSANPQTSHEELRKMAQNPFADVIKLPIEEDVYSGMGPFSRNASALQIQPVFQIAFAFLCGETLRSADALMEYHTHNCGMTHSLQSSPSRRRSWVGITIAKFPGLRQLSVEVQHAQVANRFTTSYSQRAVGAAKPEFDDYRKWDFAATRDV